MYTLLTILFILTCALMVVVILMQAGKGQGLAGSLGGFGAGGAIFGGRGAATFLSKATMILAITYGALCLVIGYLYKTDTQVERESLIQQQQQEMEMSRPANLPVAPTFEPAPGDTLQ
jgi:preprotein translocase subunit SecG